MTSSAGRLPNPARAPNPPAANTALSRSVRNLSQIRSFIEIPPQFVRACIPARSGSPQNSSCDLDRRLQTDFYNRFTRTITYAPVSSLEIGFARRTVSSGRSAGMEGLESATVTALDQLGDLYARPSE